MSVEDILLELKTLLNEGTDEAFLEHLAMQSSYIVFDGAHETLFRPGDAPKGFYWILSGQVEERVSKDVSVLLGSGSMIGLEEFLTARGHLSTFITCTRTETLFVDSRCFQSMDNNEVTHQKITKELVNHLMRLKEACQMDPQVMVRPA